MIFAAHERLADDHIREEEMLRHVIRYARRSLITFVTAILILALLTMLGLLFGSSHAAAQTPGPISTDRPGQATPPALLSPGFTQIEAGFQYAADGPEERRVTTLGLPGAVIRIGMLERMELRLGGEFRSLTTAIGDANTTISGAASLSLGTKIAIAAEEGAIPETAFLLTLGLPVGNEDFRPQSVAPTFALSTRNALSNTTNLYLNLGGSWDGLNGTGTGFYAALLGATLVGDLSGFAEVYGAFPPGASPVHAVDAGFAYAAAPNLQLDLFGGTGITDTATDFFVNAGISLRLPE